MTTYVWTEISESNLDGTEDSELLIIPEEVLHTWLPMMAVLECRAWGEIKALGPTVYQEVLGIAGYGEFADYIANFAVTGQAPGLLPGPEAIERFAAQQEADVPADDDDFEPYDAIPMVADGDWPPSIHLLMADHLPEEVLQKYATWTHTVFNGDFAHIALEHKDATLEMLSALGHAHREDGRVYDLVGPF